MMIWIEPGGVFVLTLTGCRRIQIARITWPTFFTRSCAYDGSQMTALQRTVSSPDRTPVTTPFS